MLKSILSTAACAALIASTALAGETTTYTPSKNVMPIDAPILYGTGAYIAVQAGASISSDVSDSQVYDVGPNTLQFKANDNVGFVGGLKFGYVFGTGTVRPVIELDTFYNGVQADFDTYVNGSKTGGNVQANFDSVAGLANFMLNFSFGSGRIQPHIGVGIGGYYGEANDVQYTTPGGTKFSTSGGSGSGLAWQIVSGTDFYINSKTSIFVEGKFLNYEDAGISGDTLTQNIAVLGMRWHF